MRRRGSATEQAWFRQTALRQMVLLGAAAVVLELLVVYVALTGLHRIEAAHEDLTNITKAQQYFQDADMAHDALRAEVLQAILDGRAGAAPAPGLAGRLEADAAEFRANLRRVDDVRLAADVEAALAAVRPAQDRYVASALELGQLARTDPAAAQARLASFTADFVLLERMQADGTEQLADEADAVKAQARRDERTAQWRILLAAFVAIAGLLAMTWWLTRLGRALAAHAARERGVAETLQHSLLPDALPDLPGIRLAARYLPGGAGSQVGGDWYDVIGLPNGAVGLVMGDVVGHDLRAAALMGQLRNALRAYAAEGAPPGEVLERLNHLCTSHGGGEMATCLYAVLNPVASTVDVANAGHYPPLLVDSSGRVTSLEQEPRPPVGAVRGTHYPTVRHAAPGGSTLVLFTDGLVERRGVPVEHNLGSLAALLQQARGEDVDTFCDRVLAGALDDQTPTDDVALLVIQPSARLGPHLELSWPAEPSCLVEVRRTLERWLGEAGADETEIYEIVVACSEAATNAVEHAYGPGSARFDVVCHLEPQQRLVTMVVRDYGNWRDARGRDRGRGLLLLEGLMDDVEVTTSDAGTEVRMSRRLARSQPGETLPTSHRTASHSAGVPA